MAKEFILLTIEINQNLYFKDILFFQDIRYFSTYR